jgi:hypothetical protein
MHCFIAARLNQLRLFIRLIIRLIVGLLLMLDENILELA